MRPSTTTYSFIFLFLASAITFSIGCNNSTAEKTESKTDQKQSKIAGHDHSSWWCDPHGIPEEVCSMCSDKAIKEFKAKGDWCEKHNRAKSQCFICNPELAEGYAKLYRAKYGKEPPKRME